MQWTTGRALILALACTASLVLPGCGKDEPPAQPGATGEAPPPPVAQAGSAADSPWTPEALEDLLAPVALYPDPVLAQVLATSTNPQEVLDAGNWLIQNPNLSGKELERAASAAGFTPPMIALVQFPTVVDMMCMQMDWTNELGTAFRADEPGVLDAVQRLRKQAVDMGNLSSSEQLKVSTEEHQGQQVVVVQPAQPQVVYVPQYDPQTVYTQPAPAATTTTTTTETGHSTGALITTGLLAFGAGILVNEAFDDDDDDDWDYPHWGYGYGGPPYYPPPYRPVYGGGYRPGYGYNRPPNYQHGFNNNNIYVNAGDDYWNRFDTDRRNNYRNDARSPISQARPNRPELQNVNSQLRSRPAGTWKGREGYAGASRPQAGQQPRDRTAAAGAAKPAVSGSYAGAKDRQAAARVQQNAPAGARDRGRAPQRDVAQASRPQTPAGARPQQQRPAAKPAPKREQGLQHSRANGQAERAASKRGRESMPQGARKQPKAQQRSGGGQRKRGN
jgi:hypothetical protein